MGKKEDTLSFGQIQTGSACGNTQGRCAGSLQLKAAEPAKVLLGRQCRTQESVGLPSAEVYHKSRRPRMDSWGALKHPPEARVAYKELGAVSEMQTV